jgi:hypothetical protein
MADTDEKKAKKADKPQRPAKPEQAEKPAKAQKAERAEQGEQGAKPAKPERTEKPGKSGEGKSGEGKSGEGKSGEGKSGEGKSGEGKSGEGKSGEAKAARAPEPRVPARLRVQFDESIRGKLAEQFGYKSRMQIPVVDKIVINMGIGEGVADRKKVESAAADLALISGQKAVITKARKSIATYKLRDGQAIGCKAAGARFPRAQSEELRRPR